MEKKPKDRILDIPAEANRDKHINFEALENDETDSSEVDEEKLKTESEDERPGRFKTN